VLSGHHPLGEAQTAGQWLALIREGSARPLAELVSGVPGPLADVVMRLCAPDPAARYRSAAQAYDELAGWLANRGDAPVVALPPLTRAPYLAAPRLIGRQAEKDQIAQFVTANLAPSAAPRTEPPLLVLSGPAGVGKSRLLSWLLQFADQYEPRVIIGHGRSEIGVPFESVLPILRGLQDAETESPQSSDGADHTQTNTSVSLPSGSFDSQGARGGHGQGASMSLDLRPDTQGLRELLHKLSDRLLAAVERKATLVVVEDLQWSDVETLELLKLWTRSLAVDRADGRDLPVALVVTRRPVASDAVLATLVGELQAEGRAAVIEVDLPPPVTTVELAAELLMCPADYHLMAVCERLFGNRPATPLYVGQVLRLLLSRGVLTRAAHPGSDTWDLSTLGGDLPLLIPATVEEAIGERARRLSVETKTLLSAAAVLGRRFALKPARSMAGLAADMAADCVEEAVRAGFVAETPGGSRNDGDGGFVFVHERLREALYAALPAEQRRQLHGAAAAALLAQSQKRGRDLAADLAHHFHLAEDHRPAYRFSTLAGELALRAQQFSRASDLFTHAVGHADALRTNVPFALLTRLGQAAALALHVERAEVAYRRALAAFPNRDRRLSVLTRMGEMYDRAHRAEDALDCYRRALRQGLPWHLRGALVPWLLLAIAIPLLLLPPPVVIAVCRLLFWRQRRSRRQATQLCARAASGRALVHGRVRAAIHFGVFSVATGLAGPPHARGAAFAYATAALQLAFALAGLEGKSARWSALGARTRVDVWRDDSDYFCHLTRGAAWLFLARERETIAELRQAFALALARKDPWHLEAIATALFAALHLYARGDEAAEPLRALRRFVRAEDLRNLVPLVAFNEGLIGAGRWDFGPAHMRLRALCEQPNAFDAHDVNSNYLARVLALQCEARLHGPGADLGQRVLDLLRAAERSGPMMPVHTFAGYAFALAVEVWAPLAKQAPVPPEVVRQLARSRRRVRLIDGRGRWRRPYWRVCWALHDSMRGRQAAARRHLERGFEELELYGLDTSLAWLCAAGQRVFPPGSDLARRCADELEAVVARRPGLRAGVERTTKAS
jgi:hypothetical protein